MKERLNSLLSEVGESFDYLRSDVRNLGRYLAELEELIEGYRVFAASLTLSTSGDRTARGKLLKKTCMITKNSLSYLPWKKKRTPPSG